MDDYSAIGFYWSTSWDESCDRLRFAKSLHVKSFFSKAKTIDIAFTPTKHLALRRGIRLIVEQSVDHHVDESEYNCLYIYFDLFEAVYVSINLQEISSIL